MTATQRSEMVEAVRHEIGVFERTIARDPRKDYWGMPQGDIRKVHLTKLRETLYDLNRIKVEDA